VTNELRIVLKYQTTKRKVPFGAPRLQTVTRRLSHGKEPVSKRGAKKHRNELPRSYFIYFVNVVYPMRGRKKIGFRDSSQ